MSIDSAMVLAAGRGSRLGELGRRVPKALIEVDGKPLIVRHLQYLAEAGVRNVVVNAHHLADQLEDVLKNHGVPIDVTLVRETRLLGTAGGVRNALHLLGERPFVVLYVDVAAFHQPLADIIEWHNRHGADATLCCYRSGTTFGKGVLEVDREGRVVGFTEKAPDARPGLVNAGLYVLRPDLLDRLSRGVASDFGHDVFPDVLARGRSLRAYRLPQPVLDIGTPEALAALQGRDLSTSP